MPAVRGPSRIYPSPVRIPSGPWIGVRDASEANVSKGDNEGINFLLSATNMYLAPGPDGKPWKGRPGCTVMGASALGAGGVRTGQALYTWTQESGTRITVAICGGKFYTYNFTTNTFTEMITAANMATASVALSTTARVALVPFAGVLVVSDGVNQPWTWDGTAGAGGIVPLTNAPVFFGPPVVYYAKLAGIKASERNTFVWSEEATPNTGYEAAGYNNAWTVGQATNANLMFALAATNEALIVYRERATTSVTGAMNADFQTAGTRASISEDIGTRSPWSVKTLQSGVLMLDADASPYATVQAISLVDLWKDCESTSGTIQPAALDNAITVRDRACNVALVGVAIASTVLDTFLTFNVDTGQFQGVWNGFTFDTAGELIDDNGRPRWGHFGHADGIPMLHALPTESFWNDELSTGTQPVARGLKPRPMFRDLDREIQVDRIGFGIGVEGTSQCTISCSTSRGEGMPQAVSLSTSSGSALYGSALYGTAVYAGTQATRRAEVGTSRLGRWVTPEFRHSVLSETCSVTDCRVVAFEVAADPGVP